MKNLKTKMAVRKLGALLITSSLCISTLGISYSYFGETLTGQASVALANMKIENEKSGKIEYDYDKKVLSVIFDLKNTGDLPVKLHIKNAEAIYNSFSHESGQKIFTEYEDSVFDEQLLEPDKLEKEFIFEFINVDVEDSEYGYFEAEVEIEYLYSETESWKDTLKIEAIDENRQDQAERYLQYLTSLEAAGAAQQVEPEISSEPVPEIPIPSEPGVPGQPIPEQPAPEQPAPEQPVPEQPVPEQPVPEQPVPEQPVPEQPAPEQPTPATPEVVNSPTEMPSQTDSTNESASEGTSEASQESSDQAQNDSEEVAS